MVTIIDSAKIADIKKWFKLLNVDTITTNPHLLAEAGIKSEDDFEKFIDKLIDEIESPTIFFQCFSSEDVNSLKKLQDKYKSITFVAKITMLPQFYPLIHEAKDLELQTAATTCYDLVQIHQACEFGMDYSMVYCAKNDNTNLLYEAIKMKKDYNYQTELVAASFRTKNDVLTVIKSGIDYATIPPSVLELAYDNINAKTDVSKVFGK